MKNLNIIKVVDDIASCELLTDEVKLKALDDLLKMVKDEKYAKKVDFDLFYEQSVTYPNDCVGENHVWCKSDLGTMFWGKLNQIVY